ncbi:cytochrome-c peroxidase [Allorhizobium taibaishanense]|uniref:Methylamine utilization protein MauG n=1 Tax=Allorhizobium taibaishanense TaxID=887144 RepID=A0A1Q9ABS5_9HYPH|nr:cytochrome c peroxidase [Allorhizobium taibaishanense]MBB4010579.1 cytochrome c peroxidase [Allorhizobium taibaishanense]OLP52315.1 tryptophan tryptophylquinone biosynthesis enzyme MauG [Allorhizobium taibaishanense]
MKVSIRLCVILVALPLNWSFAGDRNDFKRPVDIPYRDVTPYSPQLATLGKMLFFDPRLSGAQNMTCASCHNPSFGFEVPVKTPVGAANQSLPRQAPTVLNAAWVSPLFWDGRAPTLESQAEGPITAAGEMNGKFDDIVKNLSQIHDYNAWFKEVFPRDGMTKENMLIAIATYERTVVTTWSPFDRWVDGDEEAISADAKRGFGLFTGKAGCSACHAGWNFTDNKFHDVGLPDEDIGRGKYEPENIKAQHAFKTPGLRNTLYRAPYMHDGSLATLSDVIQHYESGGVGRPSLADAMFPFSLDTSERADLLAFLKTLTAEKQNIPLPTLPN